MILVPGGKKCYCGKLGCADAYCAASVLTDETHQTLEQFMAHLEEKEASAEEIWQDDGVFYTERICIFGYGSKRTQEKVAVCVCYLKGGSQQHGEQEDGYQIGRASCRERV